MSLSFIKVPEYDLTLSNNNVVKYRPFLIKEEKVLLMAVESRDEAEMNNALINIVQSCTLSKIDVTKLPVYDFEYLWLNIRGCLLYTSPSPRDSCASRMPSSA